MSKYDDFNKKTEEIVKRFKAIPKDECIRVISHFDADGISASAIMIRALERQNRPYTLSILQHLDTETLTALLEEPYNFFVFTDLGSGQLENFRTDKTVFILDHHQPSSKEDFNLNHLNPHRFNIDGSEEVSGAGVAWYFAQALDKRNEDMAHVAIIGALGDIQEKGSFLHLNQVILQTAIQHKKIRVEKGLRLYGARTRPLHKVLEWCTDPYIPGVTGSESGTLQFIQQLGIVPTIGKKWKKITDLTNEELEKLIAGIILLRHDQEEPEDVLGNSYILLEEKEGTPLCDAREFATMLNACGRLDKPSVGVGALLGDPKKKSEALRTSQAYRRQIVKIMKWYEKSPQFVIKGNHFVIINAKEEVPSTMVGVFASMLARSNQLEEGTYIVALSRMNAHTTKISLRVASKNNGNDLRTLAKNMIGDIDGEYGGHHNAAGAVIPTLNENQFIENAETVLTSLSG